MKTIPLNELAPYLAYGLKMQIERKVYPMSTNVVLLDFETIKHITRPKTHDIQPIVRPLEELIPELKEYYDPTEPELVWFDNLMATMLNDASDLPYYLCEKILSMHGDLFNWLESGLAITKKEVKNEQV